MKGWERNIGERREGDTGMKGVQERMKEDEELKYERNNSSFNFNGEVVTGWTSS